MCLYQGMARKADSLCMMGLGRRLSGSRACVQAWGPEFDAPEPVFKRVAVIACPGGAETGRCLGLSDQPAEVNSISEFQAGWETLPQKRPWKVTSSETWHQPLASASVCTQAHRHTYTTYTHMHIELFKNSLKAHYKLAAKSNTMDMRGHGYHRSHGPYWG